MPISAKVESKLRRFFNQFQLIKPYNHAEKLIIFPHSGTTFFFNKLHRQKYNKCINPKFRIGENDLASNLFKMLQETDTGFEHSVLPFLLSGKNVFEKQILPKNTWAFVNLGHRITSGDVNRGLTEPQKILPKKTFTGLELFSNSNKHSEYVSWIIKNHVKPFQQIYLEILEENPEIKTVIFAHSFDPLSGNANIKTVFDDSIRPMAQIFHKATIFPKLHQAFFKNRGTEPSFETELIPSRNLNRIQKILEDALLKYYIGPNPKVLIDSPYSLLGYEGVCLCSNTCMFNKNINVLQIEANKAALCTHRDAGLAYLKALFKISDLYSK